MNKTVQKSEWVKESLKVNQGMYNDYDINNEDEMIVKKDTI